MALRRVTVSGTTTLGMEPISFFSFEDNYIIMIAPTGICGFSDTIGGARYCVRYNHVVNGAAGDHGTEGQNLRNLRVAEWYGNWFEYTHPTRSASLGARSGGKLMHDNTITGSPTSLGQLQMFRGWSYGYQGAWGPADGSSPWDMSVTDVDSGGGYPTLDKTKQRWVDGHSSYVFFTGTVSTNSSAGTLTDTTQSWTPGMWVGYSVHNVEAGYGSYITANSTNTITYVSASPPRVTFNAGQHYEIRRVLRGLDMTGSGKGDLLSGSRKKIKGQSTADHHSYRQAPINTATGNRYWPHQVHEPTITWNNKNTTNNQELAYNTNVPWVRVGTTPGTIGGDGQGPGYVDYMKWVADLVLILTLLLRQLRTLFQRV
jgi:hypothetical protein